MLSGWNNIFKLAVTGLLIFLLGSQIAKHQNNLLALREMSAVDFILIAGIVIASLLINASKLKILADSYNIQLNPHEVFGLSSITTSLNNFFFKAGSLFTSNYLKQRHEFPFMSFAGTQGADHLILFFINALCGLIVSLALVFEQKEMFSPLVIGYFSATAFLILVFSKTFNFQHRSNKFLNALIRAINSLYRILKNKKLFCLLCFHNILIVGLNTLRLFLVCKALSIEIPFGYCLLFITLTPVISAIPIIQSDLGTRELAIGVYSQWLGMGFQTGMLATLLDRCFVLLWAILVSLYYRNLFFSTKAVHTRKN
jgi:hypothetical protein